MSHQLQSKKDIRYRKLLSLIYLSPLVLPLYALYLSNTVEKYNLCGWGLLGVMAFFVVIDQVFGKEWANPTSDAQQQSTKNVYYTLLLFSCIPAVVLLSFYGAYFFSITDELNWAGRIGWIISLGLAIAALSLCPAHELIHRETLFERLTGGFLIAFVCNAGLKIEHIRGHHVKAATPEDIYSAKLNQTFYHFLLQGLYGTIVHAWFTEGKRLKRHGFPIISLHNELLCWNAVSLVIAVLYYFVFGLFGSIFFIGQGLVALTAQQLINYIQHYGLSRRKLNDGCYEKFSASHAWSCNFLISNMASFCLPRHTDHHLNPKRPYPFLSHFDQSPQMPLGYFGMFFLALIPPLWFKVMNRRLLAYNRKAN